MGKNVVREDVVKISYEVDDRNLQSLSKQVDKLGSGVASSVSKADGQFGKLSAQAQSLSQKVGIAGKAAKDNLNGIAPAAVKAGGGVKKLSDHVSTLSSKLSSAGKKLQSFGKNAGDFGGKLSLGITTPIADAATFAVKTGNDFEAEMSRVKAIAGASNRDFQKLTDQAIKLGADTNYNSTEAANGMENLASAGFDVSEIMEAMPGMLNLAASSGEDLANSADIAASTLRGFGLAASQSGHVADVLAKNAAATNAAVGDTGEAMKYIAPVAQNAGWSLESVTAAIGIMSNAGIKGEQAGTTLRGALTNLMNPSDVAAKSMKSIGFSAYDAQGKMKPLSQIVGELGSKTQKLTAQQRDQVIATIMGTESLSGMQVLLKNGKSGLDGLTASLVKSDGAAQEMAVTMMDNTKGSIEQMNGSLETAAITVQRMVAPSIKEAADKVSELANSFTKLNPNMQKTILGLVGITAAVGPVMKIFGPSVSMVGKLVGAIGKLAGKKSPAKTIAETAEAAAPAAKKVGLLSKAGTALSGVFAAIPLPAKIALGVGAAAAVGIGLAIKKAHDDAVKADLAKRFGDITLSAEECADAAKKLTSTPWTIKLDGVSEAKSQIDGFQKSIDSAAAEMEKSEWKVNMGLKLSTDEQNSFQESADSLAQNAVSYLEQKHYTANLAINAVLMPGSASYKSLTNLTDNYYSAAQTETQRLSDELSGMVSDALKDGVLTSDETGGIEALQTSIQGIVEKASNTEYKAKLKALSVTASAGGLTADSFQNLTTEIGKQTTASLGKADESLKVIISNLDMQLADGAISKSQYDSLVKDAQSSLNQRKAELQMKNYSITMEPLGQKYQSELSGFQEAAQSSLASGLQNLGMNTYSANQFAGHTEATLREAFSHIDSTTRDGLQQMLKAAKPQTDEMEKTKQAWVSEGKVPPTAFMQSLQGTFEKEIASGDLTHQWDFVAGQISSDSSLRSALDAEAKAGKQIPDTLAQALKSEYGLVYEAGKGLIQQTKPEPTLVDNVKSMVQESGWQITDALAQSISDKGTDVAYQVKDLLSTLNEGYKLDAGQLISLYTDLGMTIPKSLADALAKQEPAVQREVSKILADLEGGTHLDQSKIETFFKGFGKDLPDAVSKQVAGIKNSSTQKSLMTAFTDMYGGQALNKSQSQSLLSNMNLKQFTGLSQGISKTADANKQMQVVDELTLLGQNVKLKSDDLKTLFTNLNASLPKSITDLLSQIGNAADQSKAVNLFGKLYTGAQLGAEELKSAMRYAGVAIPDALATSFAAKSPAAQQAAVSLFQSVQSGVRASAGQLTSYFSSFGITIPSGLTSSLANAKPAVQNQAAQLIATIGTAADSQRPALIATLARVGGQPIRQMLASMNMALSSDGTLVSTAKGKAGQVINSMDARTASAILQSPKLSDILNSVEKAQQANSQMQGYLNHHTLTQTVQVNYLAHEEVVSGNKYQVMSTSGGTIIKYRGKAAHNAAGGVLKNETLSWLAEGNKAEVVIPLQAHRSRAIGLWQQAGEVLGTTAPTAPRAAQISAPHTSYTPKYSAVSARTYQDHSVYAPVFQANFASNTASDREQERKVKKWVSDAIQSALESRNRRSPAILEV